MKKLILTILGIIIIAGIGIGGFYMFNNHNNSKDTNDTEDISSAKPAPENKPQNDSTKKTAIVYFSATGTTKSVAEKIAAVSGGDIFEIVPAEPYTSADLNYNSDCRANREQNDANARPDISNDINLDGYDTIYLGYPIWWGTMPKIILSFVEHADLTGKAIIPFCTSGGSGITTSVSELRDSIQGATVLDGQRFSASTSEAEIESWLNSK